MEAKNMAELKKMLMDEVKIAMRESNKEMKKDMEKETKDYYSGSSPILYERTGALGKTPKTSPVKVSSMSAEFEVYLNTSGGYTTGDNPSMLQVLNLANYGQPWITSGGRPANPTIGKPGFWERGEDRMSDTFNNIMGKHFY